MAMAIVAMATLSTTPSRAEELLAHLCHATTSIANWVTNNQGGNMLQLWNLLEHLQPSKLLLAVSKLPRFLIHGVPTASLFQAAWRIFATRSLGWINRREKGCSKGFSIEFNYYLQHSIFVDGETHKNSSRCSSLGLTTLTSTSTPRHCRTHMWPQPQPQQSVWATRL